MKKYFLKRGSRESGPFILDDLRYQRVDATTWYREENGTWQQLAQNAELCRYLGIKTSAKSTVLQQPALEIQATPKTALIVAVIIGVLFLAGGLLFAMLAAN